MFPSEQNVSFEVFESVLAFSVSGLSAACDAATTVGQLLCQSRPNLCVNFHVIVCPSSWVTYLFSQPVLTFLFALVLIMTGSEFGCCLKRRGGDRELTVNHV